MSTSEPIASTVWPSTSGDSNESGLTLSTYQSQSTTSLPTTTNTSIAAIPRITFAPLPPIEPRKRRSTSQIRLGVSARSSMVRRRRSTPGDLNNGEPDQPQRDQEAGWGGALKKPLDSGMCQDEKMACPKAKIRSERPTDLEDPFLAVGRMVKSAWRRVAQTHTQSTPPNGSAGVDDDSLGRSKQELDAPNKPSLEKERKAESELECEKQRQYSHEFEEPNVNVKVPSVEGLGNAPIRNSSFKIKKPVLTRSASEPRVKATTVASTFRGR